MDNFSDWEYEADTDDYNSSVLLSIGDMMSGLLMIFAILFITVLLQLSKTQASRQGLIEAVIYELKKNDINVEVNPKNGEINLGESILFAENSAELTDNGKKFLRSFIPVYSDIIFSQSSFKEVITGVVIEGHTSSKGTDDANLQLSLLRSFSVAKYIFSPEMKFKTQSQIRQITTASGRGEIESRQDIDEPKDRKVTFRLQFKGDDLSQIYIKK
ncbi:OmpA family protein [Nostoc sp. FACHB-190]|uniref:OmpA family protein n=1 Tax=Nostoc sp. FACHB-190 TaxID=2692838 RepID=UPI0016849FD5|nr:OmpA family protein [Nostoc sp. FACHB-190]MBD2298623.1 OmpA family protein [Nostoc sp. FACHB-190]